MSQRNRRRGLFGIGIGWVVLVLLLAVFAGVRLVLERQRQDDALNWQRRGKLVSMMWYAWDETPAAVEKLPVCRGQRLQFQPTTDGIGVCIANLDGGKIDPAYAGWTVLLRFGHRVDGDDQELIMTSGEVKPPAGMTLRRKPRESWWAVEYLRAIFMLAAMVAWGGCVVLAFFAGGGRRQVTRWALAAALVALALAAMESEFRLRGEHFIGSTWFSSAIAMAISSVLLFLLPNPKPIDDGRCPKCGYNLTGNESGICPECGAETPAHLRQRRLERFAPAAERLNEQIIVDAEMADDEVMAVDEVGSASADR